MGNNLLETLSIADGKVEGRKNRKLRDFLTGLVVGVGRIFILLPSAFFPKPLCKLSDSHNLKHVCELVSNARRRRRRRMKDENMSL
jgi:hypothetical protein